MSGSRKRTCTLLMVICCAPWLAGSVCDERAGFVEITNEQGFGDPYNKFSWSMAEFTGDIYVGTMNMDLRPLQPQDLPDPSPDFLAFWEDIEELIKTDGGEIWRYHPGDGSWTQVWDMEGVEPNQIGFRIMTVFQGALYAGTFNKSGPAQIWTSPNGTDWFLSHQMEGQNRSIRGMAVVGDHLYAGTDNRDEEAELWRFDGVAWELAHVFDGVVVISVLAEMDGLLYIGTWGIPNGFELYRYDGQNVELLVGVDQHSPFDLGIMSMHPFGGKLYFGTSDFVQGFSLYRYDPITGGCEQVGRHGFGWPSNAYAWRLEEHRGRLYLGTFNTGTKGGSRRFNRGLQLWSSANGEEWLLEVANGFGDVENYGVRSLMSTGNRLYLGTANNMFTGHGTQVWMRDDTEQER